MLSCHLSVPDLNSGRGKNSLLLIRRTMARSSSRKRLNLSPPEEGEEGWILVDKRRRRAPTPPPAPDYRVYLILNHEETSTFHTAQRLEREHPDLRVRVQEKSGLAIYIKPLNEEAAFSFARLSRETTTGISLGEVECRSKGIVSLYPLGQSLRPILEDSRVTFARCIYNAGHCRREPTRQVEVTFRGPLPASLDLAEVLQDRRSLRRVQRETSLLTVYRDTEDRKQLGCTMSELWREPPRLVQGLPQTAEEAPPSPLGCDRRLAPKEPGCLPSGSSCLTPLSQPEYGRGGHCPSTCQPTDTDTTARRRLHADLPEEEGKALPDHTSAHRGCGGPDDAGDRDTGHPDEPGDDKPG